MRTKEELGCSGEIRISGERESWKLTEGIFIHGCVALTPGLISSPFLISLSGGFYRRSGTRWEITVEYLGVAHGLPVGRRHGDVARPAVDLVVAQVEVLEGKFSL